MIAKKQVHHLGSWSLNGALAKFDDESDDGDDNEKDGADDDDYQNCLAHRADLHVDYRCRVPRGLWRRV